MIKLSNSSIYYAVMKCVETPNYKIIIAISKRSQIEEVFNKCIEVVEKFNFDMPLIQRTLNYFSMQFQNGSSIKCIYANENTRGNAAHLVIYDQTIDDDIKNCVLHPIEKIRE